MAPQHDNDRVSLVGDDIIYGSMDDRSMNDDSIHVIKNSDELMGFSDDTNKLPKYMSERNGNGGGHDERLLIKTQSTFGNDLLTLAPGSVPHSLVLAVAIGVTCGVAAFLYYTMLFQAIHYLWQTLPQQVWVPYVPVWMHVLWIPLVALPMALGVGLTVKYMGEPGDLPYTIKCVHEKGYIAMDHVMPMVAASQFSILGGGSLGPEAPLVAICAALGGFISRHIFRVTERNLVRKHTLMGMAGALAAFFGCPLGGSLFAMEVNSRFGVEYFEHTVEAVFCGEVCLVVFRLLAGLPIEAIWNITDAKLPNASAIEIMYGACLGLAGAGMAWCFAKLHVKVMHIFTRFDLLNMEKAVARAMLGAVVVVLLGMLVPHTMFWGEFEFQTIATMGQTESLPHIWPTDGLIGFEMSGFWTAMIVGVAKLVAISFTVAGGYRGGYIFPAFAAAAAVGRAIFCICPFIPVQLCVLCMAAGLNVALTRTALSTTLILAYLSGDQNTISAVLCASLVSLFATSYMPFIKTQMVRADLDNSLYYSEDSPEVEQHSHDHCRKDSDATNSTMDVTPVVSMHKMFGGRNLKTVQEV